MNLLQAGNFISNISGISYDVNQRDVMFAEDFYTNSSVDGMFSGWHGSTVVTLEDGTAWKQIETVESSQSTSYSPFATYVEMQDGWFIWIEGTNQMVQVEKL